MAMRTSVGSSKGWIRGESGVSSALVYLGDTTMSVTHIGVADNTRVELIWAHGWGLSGESFAHLARALERDCASTLLDLPGFGAAAEPPSHWGTADYADAIAQWLRGLPPRPRFWIGHSFGCRIGLQLAARHPDLIEGAVLIAAAGLQRRRTVWQALSLKARIQVFKLAKLMVRSEEGRQRLYAHFGSADARSAGPMRAVFTRTVNEDLSGVARNVSCRTLLLYGSDDEDTPPEIGERLQQLIPHSELFVLTGFDHHTILTTGRHQLVNEIRKFIVAK